MPYFLVNPMILMKRNGNYCYGVLDLIQNSDLIYKKWLENMFQPFWRSHFYYRWTLFNCSVLFVCHWLRKENILIFNWILLPHTDWSNDNADGWYSIDCTIPHSREKCGDQWHTYGNFQHSHWKCSHWAYVQPNQYTHLGLFNGLWTPKFHCKLNNLILL